MFPHRSASGLHGILWHRGVFKGLHSASCCCRDLRDVAHLSGSGCFILTYFDSRNIKKHEEQRNTPATTPFSALGLLDLSCATGRPLQVAVLMPLGLFLLTMGGSASPRAQSLLDNGQHLGIVAMAAMAPAWDDFRKDVVTGAITIHI